jgi:hypothetical protein
VVELPERDVERVDGVQGGAGERCGALRPVVPVGVGPGGPPAPDHAGGHQRGAHDPPDPAVPDQSAHEAQFGVVAALQADGGADPRGIGAPGQFAGLGQVQCERPLGVDRLARVDRRRDELPVVRDLDRHDHDVHSGVGEEIRVVVEGRPDPELLRGRLRGLAARGADGTQFEVGMRRERGYVADGGPASPAAADDADTDGVHVVAPSTGARDGQGGVVPSLQ